MKLIDLATDNIFYFIDDDIRTKYLRVDMGFVDVFTGVFVPLDGTLGLHEIIKVDRSLLWREGAQNNMPQYIVESRVKEFIEKYKKQVAVNLISEYFFVCVKCKKKNRKSRDFEKAKSGLCKKCRLYKN